MLRNLRKKPDLTQPEIAHTGKIRIKEFSMISNIFKKKGRKIYAIHEENRVLLARESW